MPLQSNEWNGLSGAGLQLSGTFLHFSGRCLPPWYRTAIAVDALIMTRCFVRLSVSATSGGVRCSRGFPVSGPDTGAMCMRRACGGYRPTHAASFKLRRCVVHSRSSGVSDGDGPRPDRQRRIDERRNVLAATLAHVPTAVEALTRGQAIAVPTDTIYGLAADSR